MNTKKIITLKLKEFLDRLKSQGVKKDHFAFKCPICHTIQSAHDLIKAGAGKDFNDVERFLGFSCIGRWAGGATDFATKAGRGRGCDYTLGGLITLPAIEVIDEQGEKHPRFDIATPEEAQAHMQANEVKNCPTCGDYVDSIFDHVAGCPDEEENNAEI